MKLSDVFDFKNAKSKGFDDYEAGDVAFVTNGFRNNGIQGFVTPQKNDRVINYDAICISAFCEATVQKPNFLPRGNGGSGLLVLKPKKSMTTDDLFQIAAYINKAHSWKFSYGRMVNEERVKNLEIKIDDTIKVKKSLSQLVPKEHKYTTPPKSSKFASFNITKLFDLHRGDFHALDKLEKGKYPTVSRVAYDNGIVGFYERPKKAKVYPKGTLTVATTTGDAFVQLDDFISTDNVVILIPKVPLNLEEKFYIASMINRERWRVSYGRQCYKAIFSKTNIFLPVKQEDEINYAYMREMVENSYNYPEVKSYIEN